MLTKEECCKALSRLIKSHLNGVLYGEDTKILKQLINEHFDNPPLKFEELKEGMVVWDNLEKNYIEICDSFNGQKIYYKFGINIPYIFMFQENRYFRKQVE